MKDLHERCWLHGFGWHTIGAAGQLLERSLIDRMVGYGERLCFEGAPLILPPLAQDPVKRVPEMFEGEAIQSDRVVPRLTEFERHRVNEAKRASAEALGKPAAAVRSEHDRKLAERIAAESGKPLLTALRLVAARHRGVLFPDVELEFDHLGVVTIGAVLADPERFVGETLADPMEGVGYGRCKAMVMKGEDDALLIHSFAHGRGVYLLRHDLKSGKAAFAQAPADAMVEHALAILAQAELEEDELADFVAHVSKSANVGVRVLTRRIKKDRAQRESEKHKASMGSSTDGRIIRRRPEADGELLPTITFVDELLAADGSEEPPMRNASGAFVQVEVKQPWALHLLTAESANAIGDDTDLMKAPAEPVLAELTPIGVELLLERYVRWEVVTRDAYYFGALQAPFINALIEFPGSALPVARAINTAPLVTMSGRIIDGVGLDRPTGLVHRIDPVLRSCVPAGAPTNDEVKSALKFLLDDWLVDVALDPVGKCIAVLLALTLLQRALLPERPAFFVTAGQRGGGKTTLVHMILTAVLGRRAAAAGWSENVEERKKALFSYLRQNVAALVWDNITRGGNITCPHIEAALTASEISDRVLGVSRVETVPSSTIQIFTGNSIAPRGDMASRSFILPLDVNRPDPENRAFTHADPLAWTQANRAKILRSLYTILVGGALSRPRGQVAKTRFKTWWGLIGWPVEYAAGLLEIEVDCTQLLRAGEASEEEASAASRALTVLRECWGEDSFTTRLVVMKLAELGSMMESKVARAEALSDALGELIGKPLENPTARSVGKLFQKYLTNRPVWLADGDVVAVLRKIPGHDANEYRVEISNPRQSSTSGPRGLAPDAPNRSGETNAAAGATARSTGKAGKVGKDGNVSAAAGQDKTIFSDEPAGECEGWRARI
ncbi:hypothetical protein [Bradyrhizobium sp. sBnM-33]|uniref:hypothetical protein n=1 Tax=Bradyrhizobium sp. sBnM-33 TaxID=2831780 RepID=UPI001BCC5093|nr:hypothetical protein [Bradyrhizobium sp. sBnM-33]WOH51921.1 hypothetical protein RX328_06525 [Bradyrhizobium sp. sBnM-33]